MWRRRRRNDLTTTASPTPDQADYACRAVRDWLRDHDADVDRAVVEASVVDEDGQVVVDVDYSSPSGSIWHRSLPVTAEGQVKA